MPAKRYHHGNLRADLLAAARRLLTEQGPDRFSLRDCARAAGVSHAAPTHHFGDVRGLLTAVATEGFRDLTAALRTARADPAAADPLLATGCAYVMQAVREPGTFRVMFRPALLDPADPEFAAAAASAWQELGSQLPAADDNSPSPKALLAWSVVHGLACLILDGPLAQISRASPHAMAAHLAPLVLRELEGLRA